ncbi:Hpt domain-containing protein [Sabulicella rubraurantiaca]|uniref:Hpt domain-containing protein n=1 Tax=Sabulicella rubraurantiaca TaxID=2811429 RepID=UPI001A966AD1|nr:Hpt domain-containing protein [Sabulicella rubraurantiaca]
MSPDDPLFAEFLAESAEHLDTLEMGLTGEAPVDVLFRAMHSLKGMANALGARGMGALAHAAEEVLGRARSGARPLDRDTREALLGTVDALRAARDALAEGRDLPADAALLARLVGGEAAPAPAAAPVPAAAQGGDPLRLSLASRLAAEMPRLSPQLAEAARDAGLPALATAIAEAGSPAGYGRLRSKLALLEAVTGIPAGSAATLTGRPDPAPLLAALESASAREAARDFADAAHAHGDRGAEELGRQIQDLAARGVSVGHFRSALLEPVLRAVEAPPAPPPPPLTSSLAAALPQAAHQRAAAAMASGRRIWRLRLGALALAEAVAESFLQRAGDSLASAGPPGSLDLFFSSDLPPAELAGLRAELDPEGVALLDLAPADAPPPPPMLRVRQDRIDAVIALEAELRAATLALTDSLADPGAAQALEDLAAIQRALPPGPASRLAPALERLRAVRVAADRAASRLRLSLGQMDEAVLELRVVPFAQLAQRLHRPLRQLAEAQGKTVELVTEGEEVTLDRSLADLLADPLLHLLRNAVDHGIETPELRAAAGKPRMARILFTAERRAGRLRVVLRDDGRGVDEAAVLARARARGLLPPGANPVGEAVHALLFLPGFSTREVVSDVSGRGVGLDVVQEAARRAGGTVRVDSVPGQGTGFVLDLPLNAAIQHVLLVEASGHPYALPANRVESVLEPDRVPPGVKLRSLEELLELPAAPPSAVVLLRRPAGLMGLSVARIGRRTDLLLKPLHPEIAGRLGVGGVGVLGHGEAVLLLEPDEL